MPEENEVAERVVRPVSEDLDSILGMSLPVLNDGFIRVVDYMGGDESIVQAARVSYGAGTKKAHEDRGLIRYLLRHRHTTPFEMCEIKLHVRVPMDCWRQWIRHRTANVNEYSTRYSIAINAAQTTKPSEWRVQSKTNKQGSEEGELVWPDFITGIDLNVDASSPAEHLANREAEFQVMAREIYDERIKMGVAREQARKDLPLSTYTEAYWKVDLHNLLHFLGLRMDSHAQYEIRQYANVIGNDIVSKWVPDVWEAFQDYRMDAAYLTKLDLAVISALAQGDKEKAIAAATEFGWLKKKKDDSGLRGNRERQECESKISAMGLESPWS
jgi:thymidylate synthase (FAD)